MTTIYVNTDNVGTADGTTHATGYTSLSTAWSNVTSPLTDDVIIECAGTAVDTTAADLTGKSVSTYTITVRGNPSESSGKYDGPAAWSTSHYRISVDNFRTVWLRNQGTTLDGIQVEQQKSNNFAYAIRITSGSTTVTNVRNCRVQGPGTSGTAGIYVDGVSTATTQPEDIEANVVQQFKQGILFGLDLNRAATVNVYNNTVYDCDTGIELSDEDTADHTWNVRNNLVFDSTTEYTGFGGSPAATINFDYNAGEGSSPSGHGANWVAITPASDIEDPTNAGGPTADDLTAVESGDLDGAGTTGGPSIDITGESFASPPSIGAIEVVSVGGGSTVPVLYYHHRHHNLA